MEVSIVQPNWQDPKSRNIFKQVFIESDGGVLEHFNQTTEDKGHLVTRHLNVRPQLRLVECFRDTLNKRAKVKNHNPALSRRQGGISSDPPF